MNNTTNHLHHMSNKAVYIVLALIVFIAFALRFYKLGVIPPSIDWDEAALGYNAYSLLQTGRDEYGVKWPLVFRSFDDFKPPLYFYLTMPSVVLFGLTEFAVRFPSAFFGTLTVVLTFFLVRELFNRGNGVTREQQVLALLTSFLLAISPWHLYFSRIGFEANVGVFFNVLGVYLFLVGLKNGYMLIPSAVVFILGLYEYHSERVFLPILVILLAVIFRTRLLKLKKYVLVAGVVGVLMLVPLIKIMIEPASLMRLRGTSAFSDQTGLLSRNIVKLEDAQKRGDIIGKLVANRRITYAQVFINGYLAHFNFNWLFISGDQERHKGPGVGLMYWWEMPFLLLGLYYVAKNPHDKSIKLTIFAWLLTAPVAASPTTEVPHAVRTLVFLPMLQLTTAYGVMNAYALVKKWKITLVRKTIIACFILFAGFNLVYFLHQYFVHLPLEFSKYWQYGYKQAVAYVEKNYDKYDKIVVSTQLEQPHIFFLFYLKYPPPKYIEEGGTKSGGFEEYRNKFDKFEFRRISWDQEKKDPRILYIGPPNEIEGDGDYWIDYLDGSRAIELKHG